MDFLIRHKTMISFVFFFFFCIVSLAVQSSTFTLSFEGLGSFVVMPFQKGYNYSQKAVKTLWAGFTELNQIRGELQQAQNKLREYESITEQLSEIKNENDRLRLLLGFSERIEFESVPARIISKDPDNWFRTIIIDKGSSHGIKINMPVVAYVGDEKAVVGKIIEVRGSIARVIPLISTDMKIGVRLQENRTPGLMIGYSPSSSLCVIDYITKGSQIKDNERVVTSGQGGIFPEGILVGTVVKTIVSKSSAFQKAIVKPFIEYNRIEEVFVVKRIPDPVLVEITTQQTKEIQ